MSKIQGCISNWPPYVPPWLQPTYPKVYTGSITVELLKDAYKVTNQLIIEKVENGYIVSFSSKKYIAQDEAAIAKLVAELLKNQPG